MRFQVSWGTRRTACKWPRGRRVACTSARSLSTRAVRTTRKSSTSWRSATMGLLGNQTFNLPKFPNRLTTGQTPSVPLRSVGQLTRKRSRFVLLLLSAGSGLTKGPHSSHWVQLGALTATPSTQRNRCSIRGTAACGCIIPAGTGRTATHVRTALGSLGSIQTASLAGRSLRARRGGSSGRSRSILPPRR